MPNPTVDVDQARQQLRDALATGPRAGLFRAFYGQSAVYPAALSAGLDALLQGKEFAAVREKVPRDQVRDALARLNLGAGLDAQVLSLLDDPSGRGASTELKSAVEAMRGLVAWAQAETRPGCLGGMVGRGRAAPAPAVPPRIDGFTQWQPGRAGAETGAAAPGTVLRVQGAGLDDAAVTTVRFGGRPAMVWPAEGGGMLVMVPAPRVQATANGPDRAPSLALVPGEVKVEVSTAGGTASRSFAITVPGTAPAAALDDLFTRSAAVLRAMGTAFETVPKSWTPYVEADPTGGLRTAMSSVPALLRQAAAWMDPMPRLLGSMDGVLPGVRALVANVAAATGLEQTVRQMEARADGGFEDPCEDVWGVLYFVAEVVATVSAFSWLLLAALVAALGVFVWLAAPAVFATLSAAMYAIFSLLFGVSLVVFPLIFLLCFLVNLAGLPPQP